MKGRGFSIQSNPPVCALRLRQSDRRRDDQGTGPILRALLAVLALGALSGPVSAKDESFDWKAYPEMSPETALPQMAAALRDDLFDAGSITNFKICYPPVKLKLKAGRPVRWTFLLSVNAKNQQGGYAGNQGMAAVFSTDKPVWVFSVGSPIPASTLAGCTRVPDEEIQRLIKQ